MTRRVLVTGAGSEIGQAICRRVLHPGDVALLHYHRRVDPCLAFQSAWQGDCRLIAADFRNPASLAAFCREIGETDVFVHAAALTIPGLLPEIEEVQVEEMLRVNITALVRICRAILPRLVTRRAGCIVVVTSVAAHRGNRGQSVYAGTKGFAEAFVRSLAAEYGPRGIRANCVAPGPVDAGSLRELLAHSREQVTASVTLPRLGTPEDVAAAVAYLAGDEAGYITGQCLHVDGGFRHGV